MPDLIMAVSDLAACHRALKALDVLLVCATEQQALVVGPELPQAVVTIITDVMGQAIGEVNAALEQQAAAEAA